MCWYHLCVFYFIQSFLISSNRRTGHPRVSIRCRRLCWTHCSVATGVPWSSQPAQVQGRSFWLCAEVQSKDFGVIAMDKGWNNERFLAFPHSSLSLMIDGVVFVGGNGGANPVSVSITSILSLFIIAPH